MTLMEFWSKIFRPEGGKRYFGPELSQPRPRQLILPFDVAVVVNEDSRRGSDPH